jgi:Transglycosylase-like domain
MALNTDEEKIREIVDQVYRNLERGIPLKEHEVKVLEQLANGGKELVDKEKLLIDTLKSLGKGLKDYTKVMYDGQQGLSTMNGGIDSVAATLELFINLLPGSKLLKFAISATVGAFASYAKAVNEQGDALFKTYQDLSKTGMATAGGMTEVYNNMQRFNYGVKELGQMTELLKENSQALASFGGTAAQGTRAFANAADEIQHSDIGKTFQMMGKTPDEINRGIAMFIKSQQAIGIQNSEIQKNLASKSSDYIMKMDLLSKLTGMSAEKLQANLDEANAQDAFNQVQYELKKKADAGDKKAAEQYERNEALAKKYAGTQFGKEIFASIGGDLSAMPKLMMSLPNVARMIQTGEGTVADIENQAGKDATRTRDTIGHLYKMNAATDFLPAKELSMIQTRFADGTAKQQEEMAKAEQRLQQEGLDPTTKEMVKLRIQQQKTRDAFQNLVNKGIDPATSAMEGFAKVTNRIVDMIPGTGSETTDKQREKEKDKSSASSASGNVSADAKQIMAAIRTHESQGNYEISAPGSNASGAYQFTDQTWQGLTKKYGMGQEYARAKLAPKDVQDAIAAKYVEEILKNNNNDPRAVFNTWYTGNAKGLISKEAMAKNNNLTADQMTAQFMEIMRKQSGQSTEPQASQQSRSSSGFQPPWLQNPAISGEDGARVQLNGPATGYRPNVTMHGTEDLTITPKSAMTNNSETGYVEINSMLQQQTSKLDELVRIMSDQPETAMAFQQLSILEELRRATQDQVNVSNKILQASR